MKVLTLTGADFHRACGRLASAVALSGFYPDVVVGIKTGGDVIGRLIAERFSEAVYLPVSASRPGTSAKNGKRSILSRLPYFVTDTLRIMESKVLSWFASGNAERNVEFQIDAEFRDLMNKSGCKVLIIDDAIDSGATLRQVKGKLLELFPRCICKSAVITVTTSSPVESPDFRLFNNKLIRFPWSTDLKR